jgi:hypothetical protein
MLHEKITTSKNIIACMINITEYQDKTQLLNKEFKNDKNSIDFIKQIKKLTYD